MNSLKTNLNLLTALLLLMLHAMPTKAQENQISEPLPYPESIISIVPQYLVMNGIRIDYDKRIGGQHWLQIAPQFYLSEKKPASDYDIPKFNLLLGTGLNLYHKYYPSANRTLSNVYISYGLSWQHFNITYDEAIFNNYVERYSNIHKMGGDVNIGVLSLLSSHIALDLYAGLGIRYAAIKSDAISPKKFDEFYSDYGYTGNIINLGFRISILRY